MKQRYWVNTNTKNKTRKGQINHQD